MKNLNFVTIARTDTFYLPILEIIRFRNLLPPIKCVLNYIVLKN